MYTNIICFAAISKILLFCVTHIKCSIARIIYLPFRAAVKAKSSEFHHQQNNIHLYSIFFVIGEFDYCIQEKPWLVYPPKIWKLVYYL